MTQSPSYNWKVELIGIKYNLDQPDPKRLKNCFDWVCVYPRKNLNHLHNSSIRGNNKFVLRGELIWVFHSANQPSLLSEIQNNRQEREHDVWEQTEAQRKAAAQCEAKEISINHSPNRFPTCVRCLPRNTESHKQLPCSGKTTMITILRHRVTQSRVFGYQTAAMCRTNYPFKA